MKNCWNMPLSIGMGGLGYLEVQEDMTYKGPIDKYIPQN